MPWADSREKQSSSDPELLAMAAANQNSKFAMSVRRVWRKWPEHVEKLPQLEDSLKDWPTTRDPPTRRSGCNVDNGDKGRPEAVSKRDFRLGGRENFHEETSHSESTQLIPEISVRAGEVVLRQKHRWSLPSSQFIFAIWDTVWQHWIVFLPFLEARFWLLHPRRGRLWLLSSLQACDWEPHAKHYPASSSTRRMFDASCKKLALFSWDREACKNTASLQEFCYYSIYHPLR